MKALSIVGLLFLYTLSQAQNVYFVNTNNKLYLYKYPNEDASKEKMDTRLGSKIIISTCDDFGWCKLKGEKGYVKKIWLSKKSQGITPKKPREQVNINFKNLSIEEFIHLVSKVTNTNILLNNKINGNVNFSSTAPVYDDELMDILLSVLETKGFTLVKNGSIYQVVRSTEASKNNLSVVPTRRHPNGALMVTQVIQIHNENGNEIAAKIRHLVSKTAKMVVLKDSNKILLSDYPKNIQTIKKVIRNIDTFRNKIVKIFKITHTDAKKVQHELNSVAKNIFNQKIEYEKVQIFLDEGINGLIVVGIPKNVAKIKKLLDGIDVKSNRSKGVKVFELKNSNAKTVLASIKDIVSKQVYADPAMKPSLSYNEEINSIIVIGKPLVIEAVGDIINQLDKEKYQVYVTARIVNINKTNSESIGIKYGFSAGNVSPSGIYAMSANFGASSLTQVASKSVLDFLGTIGSATKTGLALGATLDFLETNGGAKDVSNPSILCVNNKESSIYVGKTISIASGQTAVAGSTTSSFKREDVGLTLTIKPRVSSDDKVGLKVEATLGNIVDNGLVNGVTVRQPITAKQTVKTEVILRNGESIIIGGLFKKNEQNSKTKIPLLGDIPVIGSTLFSSDSTTVSEDSLVVILTPYIISQSNKLSALQAKLGKLALMQESYNQSVFEKIKKRKIPRASTTASQDPKNLVFGASSKRH